MSHSFFFFKQCIWYLIFILHVHTQSYHISISPLSDIKKNLTKWTFSLTYIYICQLGKQIHCIILTREQMFIDIAAQLNTSTWSGTLIVTTWTLNWKGNATSTFMLVTDINEARSRFSMSHFSSRWYLCAWKSPYALHPASQKFPQCWLWNDSNVHLMATSKLAWSSKQWMWQLNSRSTQPYMSPLNDCLALMFVTASGWDPMPRNVD